MVDNEVITNPKALANAFNKIFKNKVEKLREKTDIEPKIDPVERLEQMLDDRQEPVPAFQLKTINIQKLLYSWIFQQHMILLITRFCLVLVTHVL